MIATTIAIVGIRSARSPSSARSAASIAYATDDTGSPITVNANAINSICRDSSKRATRGRNRCRAWASREGLGSIGGCTTGLPSSLPGAPVEQVDAITDRDDDRDLAAATRDPDAMTYHGWAVIRQADVSAQVYVNVSAWTEHSGWQRS